MEVDLLIEQGNRMLPVEIKSGRTIADDWLSGIREWQELAQKTSEAGWIVYGGEHRQERKGVTLLPWSEIESLTDKI